MISQASSSTTGTLCLTCASAEKGKLGDGVHGDIWVVIFPTEDSFDAGVLAARVVLPDRVAIGHPLPVLALDERAVFVTQEVVIGFVIAPVTVIKVFTVNPSVLHFCIEVMQAQIDTVWSLGNRHLSNQIKRFQFVVEGRKRGDIASYRPTGGASGENRREGRFR